MPNPKDHYRLINIGKDKAVYEINNMQHKIIGKDIHKTLKHESLAQTPMEYKISANNHQTK